MSRHEYYVRLRFRELKEISPDEWRRECLSTWPAAVLMNMLLDAWSAAIERRQPGAELARFRTIASGSASDPDWRTSRCVRLSYMKKHTKLPKTVRRSVALPRRLVEEVGRVAPVDAASNWNRLVITALEEYAARQRRAMFEEVMANMAADPAIRAETKSINKLFRKAERDGLR